LKFVKRNERKKERGIDERKDYEERVRRKKK
jgi:hypothetical protein